MRSLFLFIAITVCDNRGPRPIDQSKDNDLHNATEYMDYGELDIAGTLMDIFEHQQFSSNISIEPGDKIRVLSNIVKIELEAAEESWRVSPPRSLKIIQLSEVA